LIGVSESPRLLWALEGECAEVSVLFDEGIICLDTTTLETFDSKVKPFFNMIVFDIFEQLMLHHDFCTFSFSEILALLMPSVEGTWKIWRTKEVDWGPSANISNILYQVTTSLLAQGN